MDEHVYGDRWGDVVERGATDLIELRWFDTTADMSAHDFQEWLATFAGCIEQRRRSRVLVDNTSFRMNPANLSGEWREANIVPRYNAAGVVRFAFHMPEGMPMIGETPAPEGSAAFPTGYFGRRQDALDWLAGQSPSDH